MAYKYPRAYDEVLAPSASGCLSNSLRQEWHKNSFHLWTFYYSTGDRTQAPTQTRHTLCPELWPHPKPSLNTDTYDSVLLYC